MTVSNVPDEHEGDSFQFNITFSEEVETNASNMRYYVVEGRGRRGQRGKAANIRQQHRLERADHTRAPDGGGDRDPQDDAVRLPRRHLHGRRADARRRLPADGAGTGRPDSLRRQRDRGGRSDSRVHHRAQPRNELHGDGRLRDRGRDRHGRQRLYGHVRDGDVHGQGRRRRRSTSQSSKIQSTRATRR